MNNGEIFILMLVSYLLGILVTIFLVWLGEIRIKPRKKEAKG